MNPAALKTNLKDLVENGTLIVNTGAFIEANLKKAGYQTNPLEDGSLDKYKVHAVDISQLTTAALDGSELSNKEKGRAKNFFALGLVFWMYGREPESEIRRIHQQFAKKPEFGEANVKVFKAGYHYGETAEVFQTVYKVPPAMFTPGMYRNITGNEAIALGLVVGAELAGKKLFYSGYPITPASSILHSLAKYKNFGTLTFQAEDEIAAMGAAIGAAYGGSIAVTASSGPGIALKGEAIGLGVMTELPVVILNVQRGGPSTGLPTKTEQSRSLPGDLRPQRRVADAGARREEPGRHVLLRDRGREDRDALHGAGDAAVATATSRTAPSRGRCRTSRRCRASTSCTAPIRRLLRLRARSDARSRARGSSPARRASSTASAASRRTR